MLVVMLTLAHSCIMLKLLRFALCGLWIIIRLVSTFIVQCLGSMRAHTNIDSSVVDQ